MTRKRQQSDSPDVNFDVGAAAGVAMLDQPVEEPQVEPTEKVLAASDVITEHWYLISELAEMVQVDVGVIKSAFDRRMFHQFTMVQSQVHLWGPDFCAWLQNAHVEYTVSASAAKLFRRTHPAQPETSAPVEPSLVDRAAALDQAQRQQERDEEDQAQREAWLAYASVLARHDSPQVEDVGDLAALMHDLSIDSAQINRDLELVARVKELSELHDQRESAGEAAVAARAALKATEARHVEELRAAYVGQRRAESHSRQCGGAADRLCELAQRRPGLFDLSSNPPNLRS